MRITLALADDLVRIAQELTGVAEKTALVREALKALIERESARRLASLGGTMPHLKNVPRHKGGGRIESGRPFCGQKISHSAKLPSGPIAVYIILIIGH